LAPSAIYSATATASISTPTPFGERAGLHGRPGGRRFLEVARVRLVHLVEVVDVGEEDGRFEHVRRICARLVEHGHEVVEGLLGLFGDRRVVEEVAVRRQRDLASCEHEVAVRRRLTVRADRRGAASV